MPDAAMFSGEFGGMLAFAFMSGVVAGWKVCQNVAVAEYKRREEKAERRIEKLEGKLGLD